MARKEKASPKPKIAELPLELESFVKPPDPAPPPPEMPPDMRQYPRRMYHPDQFNPHLTTSQGVLVKTPDEEDALGPGWCHSPAEFPKKGG